MGSGELGGDDCWGECLCFLRNRLCRLANERVRLRLSWRRFALRRDPRPMGKMTAREADVVHATATRGKSLLAVTALPCDCAIGNEKINLLLFPQLIEFLTVGRILRIACNDLPHFVDCLGNFACPCERIRVTHNKTNIRWCS